LDKYIKNLEINISNACTGRCFICSKHHGSGINEVFMQTDTFKTLLRQIEDIKIDRIDTSGCGDCFLNRNYIQFLHMLNDVKPDSQIMCYSNFSLLDKDIADEIIQNKLLHRIHVRIDSFNKYIFERSSNINQERVFNNLKYFLENTTIPVRILYANLQKYYNQCVDVLGHEPVYLPFTKTEINSIQDEHKQVTEYFKKYDKNNKLEVIKLGFSLWGERQNTKPRPDLKCQRAEWLKNIIWVSPDGSCNVCGYSDTQDIFQCGNIKDTNLWDIYTGEKRMKIIEDIETGKTAGKYPCTNSDACVFRGYE